MGSHRLYQLVVSVISKNIRIYIYLCSHINTTLVQFSKLSSMIRLNQNQGYEIYIYIKIDLNYFFLIIDFSYKNTTDIFEEIFFSALILLYEGQTSTSVSRFYYFGRRGTSFRFHNLSSKGRRDEAVLINDIMNGKT